jgi:N-acetylmuramoyl-L-alanine amidase
MFDKSMQYAAKCALIAFVFCETLLISGFAKPHFPGGKKKWVVVIDAGHGGKDPGCHGKKYKEKDVALSVALKLGKYLEENDKDVKVIYTRTTDVFIPLNERADIANRNHADFFICVHCNASKDKSAFGSATYVMGLYKAEGNLEVSKRENSSILLEKDYKKTYDGFDPNSDEGNILFAMYQNMYLAQSLDLAAKIQKEYVGKAARTDNGVKQAGFLVLWKTAMPSLLTEIGFLTNPAEETYIGSQKGQNKIAQCLFLATQEYIDEKEGVTFNANDYNLKNIQTDTTAVEDTSSVAPADTTSTINEGDAGKTNPEPVKQIDVKQPPPPSSGSADKMKASLKELHADSSSNYNKTYIGDSDKIVYKVQIASSSQPIAMDDPRFKDIPDVEMYFDKTSYKYTAGHLYKQEEATKLQNKIRERGFKDAFVIAFKGKNRVALPGK